MLPNAVAQALNFRDRMVWFHKQSTAYWQLCCQMRSLLGARDSHRQGIMLDTMEETQRVWLKKIYIYIAWGDPRSGVPVESGCWVFCVCVVSILSRVTSLAVQWCTEVNREQRSWMMLVCRCVSAGWHYYQLSARVGWMASVLSLEHSLFTLMSRTPTPTPLQPFGKRAFGCS